MRDLLASFWELRSGSRHQYEQGRQAGERVFFEISVCWRSRRAILKARGPFTLSTMLTLVAQPGRGGRIRRLLKRGRRADVIQRGRGGAGSFNASPFQSTSTGSARVHPNANSDLAQPVNNIIHHWRSMYIAAVTMNGDSGAWILLYS